MLILRNRNISKVALRSAMISNDLRSAAISYTIIAGNYAEMAEFDKAIFFFTTRAFLCARNK
jgi:hypothetical protein